MRVPSLKASPSFPLGAKPLCVVAVTVLLFATLLAGPTKAAGENPVERESASEEVAAHPPTEEAVDVQVVREVPELTTSHSDTVELSDGSYQATISAAPLNYKDDSGWHAIDNTLVASDRRGFAYENRADSHSVHFPESLNDPIRAEFSSSWVKVDLDKGAGVIDEVFGDTVAYRDVFDGVGVIYEALPGSIKESIVLSSLQARSSFTYRISVSPDLQGRIDTVERPDGGIDFVAGNKVEFTLDPAFMYEEVTGPGPGDGPVTMSSSPSGDGFVLAVEADREWLKTPGREFPIVVDPVVTFKPPARDCWIGSGSIANDSFCGSGSDYIRVGDSNAGKRRGLIEFDLSSIPTTALVFDASLGLFLDSSRSLTDITEDYFLRRVQKDWTGSATWNRFSATKLWDSPGGDFGGTDAGRLTMGGGRSGYRFFDSTWLIQDWVDGRYPNYGVILRQAGETTNNVLSFASSSHPDSDQWPQLTVAYAPPNPVRPTDLTPIDGSLLGTSTPTLSATYDDPNAGDEGYVEFEIYEDDTLVAESIVGSQTLVQPGQTSSWKVPAGELQRGHTYEWRARAFDGLYRSNWTSTPASQSFSIGAATISFTNWNTDFETGVTSYDMTLAAGGLNAPGEVAGPCYNLRCYWTVSSKYADGVVDVNVGDLGREVMPENTSSLTQRMAGTLDRETTHIRLQVESISCYLCDQRREDYDSGWMKVSDPYPTGQVSLNVNAWTLNSDTAAYDYDFTVAGSGAAQYVGPCYGNACRWRVEARYADESIGELEGENLVRGTWSFSDTVSGARSASKQVTELRAVLISRCKLSGEYWCWDPPETYISEWVPVSDHVYKDHDVAKSAVVLGPVLSVNAGFFCDAFLLQAGTHYERSTLTDQYLACEAAVAAAGGSTIYFVVKSIVDAGGSSSLDAVVDDHEKPFPWPSSTIPIPPQEWEDETGCVQDIPEWSVDLATDHIERDHGYASVGTDSKWKYGVRWEELVYPYAMNYKSTQGSRPDRCERVIDYPAVVGYERVFEPGSGQSEYRLTTTYTVVTDKGTGALVTAHPGVPGEDQ